MDLSSLTSFEVPVMWLVGLVVAIFGWKTAGKATSIAWDVGKKFGFGMVAASAMMITGLGGLGVGIGDLATRSEPLREVNQFGEEINQELVRFDGVVAKLDQETKILFPANIETEEQRSRWEMMSDSDRKLVWDLLREDQPAEAGEVTLVDYKRPYDDGIGMEVTPATYQNSIDSPKLPLQAVWAMMLTSIGLVGCGLMTGLRRIGSGKFNKPVNMRAIDA